MRNLNARSGTVAASALTLLLLALGLLLASQPGAWELSRSTYRYLVFIGIPWCVVLAGVPFAWMVKNRPLWRRAGWTRRQTLGWGALLLGAVGLTHAGILAAYQIGWAYFSYADHSLVVRMPRLVPWALPVAFLLGVAWEWVFRGVLVGLWRRAARPGVGWLAAGALSLLLGLPQVVEGFRVVSVPFLCAGVARLACLELACAALVAWGPGLFWSGLYRGVLLFVAVWGVNDWYSPLFPGSNYVSSGDASHVLFSVGPLAAAALLAGASFWRMRNERKTAIA